MRNMEEKACSCVLNMQNMVPVGGTLQTKQIVGRQGEVYMEALSFLFILAVLNKRAFGSGRRRFSLDPAHQDCIAPPNYSLPESEFP